MSDRLALQQATTVLVETTTAWGLPLTSDQCAQFEIYAQELQAWNKRLNLTSITRTEDIFVRHFLDALRCGVVWGPTPQSLIDVGTGAGFPGLPLKLLHPTLALTLVESVEKKAVFLRHLVTLLGLSDVRVVVARAETLGQDPRYRERYDVAVARAVAELRVLAEYCLPFCRVGGRFLAPKGAQIEHELEQAQGAFMRLGGHFVVIDRVQLPGVEPRTIVIVDKVKPTSPPYPRAVGVPARRPL